MQLYRKILQEEFKQEYSFYFNTGIDHTHNEGDFIHDTFMCFSKIAELLHTQVGLVTKASTMQCSSRRMNGLHKVLTLTKWDSLKEKIYKGVRDKLTKQALNDRRREETIGPCPCPRWGHPWRLNTFITKIIIK